MKTLTSLSRARFEELRQGLLDGSLAEKWRELEDKTPEELTRKQTVELRQLSWLSGLFESNPDALEDIVKRKDWRSIRVVDRGHGMAETQLLF